MMSFVDTLTKAFFVFINQATLWGYIDVLFVINDDKIRHYLILAISLFLELSFLVAIICYKHQYRYFLWR